MVGQCPCNARRTTDELGEFKNKFSRAHVPQGLVTRMRDEFRELKQDRMSVVEYRDKFLTLSRYAPDDADTEEKKKERFLNGLHDEMQPILVNIPFMDLEALVDSAIRMEGKLKQANENRKRRMIQQGGPSNQQRNRMNAPSGFAPRPNRPPIPFQRPNYHNRGGGNQHNPKETTSTVHHQGPRTITKPTTLPQGLEAMPSLSRISQE